MGRPKQGDQRVTIQAVARAAGVSPMTVSNVLNGTGRLGEATRDRVTAAIARLGYVPNQNARRLSGSAIACIGLIYPGIESIFIDAVLAAIATAAAESGIQLLMRAPDGLAAGSSRVVAKELVRSGAQGLLLLPPYAEQLGHDPGFRDLRVPAAAIATAVALPHVSTVRIDNRAAARAITERLIAAGRRRIAVIAGPAHHSDGAARLDGVRDAFRAHGLPVDPALEMEGDFSFASGLAAAERLLDREPPPDAIVAANDDMAAAALWIAHQRGIPLPDRLAVTGFDDTLIATRVWPPLTTVRQPIRLMASVAIDHLATAIAAPGQPAAPADRVLPHAIVERASG